MPLPVRHIPHAPYRPDVPAGAYHVRVGRATILNLLLLTFEQNPGIRRSLVRSYLTPACRLLGCIDFLDRGIDPCHLLRRHILAADDVTV